MSTVRGVEFPILEGYKRPDEPLGPAVKDGNSFFRGVEKLKCLIFVDHHILAEINLCYFHVDVPYPGMVAVMVEIVPKELIRTRERTEKSFAILVGICKAFTHSFPFILPPPAPQQSPGQRIAVQPERRGKA